MSKADARITKALLFWIASMAASNVQITAICVAMATFYCVAAYFTKEGTK